MPSFVSDGCKIHYETYGKGQPVILINGLIADQNAWNVVLPALSERYHTVTLDNRGGREERCPTRGVHRGTDGAGRSKPYRASVH